MPSVIELNRIKVELSTFAKGHAFEDFIVTLFNKRKFRLLEWRSDKKASNGVYPLSNTLPDLEFGYSKGKYPKRFAVECKWRKQFYNNKLDWADEIQIENYNQYQSQNGITVFVAIGIGGTPSNPEQLFITPLDHIKKYPEVFRSRLIKFIMDPLQKFETS